MRARAGTFRRWKCRTFWPRTYADFGATSADARTRLTMPPATGFGRSRCYCGAAMDKTQRPFSVMDALRRHRRPVTAAAPAEEQGVSVRTLYRDVQTLIGLGAPIDGEAGVGYMLRPGFFLPPLMFTAEELEALVLGGRWVQAQPDAGLADAARNALGKIATA